MHHLDSFNEGGGYEPEYGGQPWVTVMVTCPNDRIGKVIGPGGSGLRQLWRLARVKAIVPREPLDNGDRQIQLTGTAEQVQRAQHMLIQMIALQGHTSPMSSGFGHHHHHQHQVMLPTGHSQITPAPAGSVRLLLEASRTGYLVGKAGSGLREIREETGANFELARGDWLGGRLLTIRPPLSAQLRCLELICRKLGMAVDGSPCPVNLRLPLPSEAVGTIIGRSGGGLKSLRELGIALELPREEVVIGWRMLSISGPSHSVIAAVGTVFGKLAELAPGSAHGSVPPSPPGMFSLSHSESLHSPMSSVSMPPPMEEHGFPPPPPIPGLQLSEGRPLQPLLDQLGLHSSHQLRTELRPMQVGAGDGAHNWLGPSEMSAEPDVNLDTGINRGLQDAMEEDDSLLSEPVDATSSVAGGDVAGSAARGSEVRDFAGSYPSMSASLT